LLVPVLDLGDFKFQQTLMFLFSDTLPARNILQQMLF